MSQDMSGRGGASRPISPAARVASVQVLATTLAEQIVARVGALHVPFVVGVCGSQGSGKSTLTHALRDILTHAGYPTASLSLDDIYLPRDDRKRLAETVHPLLRTRGVPGTHDVALGLSVIQALTDASTDALTAVPRFDKASDDRAPAYCWPVVKGRPKIIIFEGWCVGARPQDPADLAQPINDLECLCDSDGRWRRYVNDRLGAEYQELFGCLDMLIFLRAPSFEQVFTWRKQQEDELRALCALAANQEPSAGLMGDEALMRFIRHYERLTRHILSELPVRADVTVSLKGDRSIGKITIDGQSSAEEVL